MEAEVVSIMIRGLGLVLFVAFVVVDVVGVV